MEIEIHGYVATIKRMTMCEITEMISSQLHIDHRQFTRSGMDGCFMKYGFGKNKESVCIRCGSADVIGNHNYITVNLHGSFFDHSPNFNLQNFISFITCYGYTSKQLDVAYTDNNKCLSTKTLTHWCRDYKDYCTGTLFRRVKPGIRDVERGLDRLELGQASSKSAYGTIYVRPDTGFIRTEIKYKAEEKIDYLLQGNFVEDISLFEDRCINALITCVDFVTPSSKKSRSPDKYIRQQSWKNFLESERKKCNWNVLLQRTESRRIEADNYDCDQSMKKTAGNLQNMIRKLTPLLPEKDIIEKFAEYSGYLITRIDSKSGSLS